ncbi:hypothetical protein BE11_39475 [Sorangium cellulosum]|nr:hypothetical protein BE11_39475 [Sorangium cellulosum]
MLSEVWKWPRRAPSRSVPALTAALAAPSRSRPGRPCGWNVTRPLASWTRCCASADAANRVARVPAR